jgi:copper chaperone CopZ
MSGTETPAHYHHEHPHDEHHHQHEQDHHSATAAGSSEHHSHAESSVRAHGSVANTYSLDGLDCGHCVETVEKAVSAVPGVESATVDLVPDGISRLFVSGTVNDAEIRDAVVAAGYSLSSK